MGACEVFLVVLLTILLPPAGAFIVAGCGTDLFINIILTILGYFPGHIHAFYLEYVYYSRRNQAAGGTIPNTRAPLVFSERVQSGGTRGYGTV